MKFAVTSQNFRTITPHAGKTRRFLLFEATPGSEPVETGRLDLTEDMAIHGFAGGPHPLDAVQVLIAGSAGPGFITHMKERGITAVTTVETNPRAAVAAYLAGTLQPVAPEDGCECGGHCH